MTSIYVLIDPEIHKIRYIGKTERTLPQRLWNHLCAKDRTRVACWVRSLVERGLRPEIRLIETTDNWADRERYWIQELRRQGCDLTNLSVGGEFGGTLGIPSSKEKREKISAANKGRKVSAETRKKIAAFQTGRSMSPATRAKISASLKGRKKPPRSPEHCARIAAKALGRKWSDEARARHSVGRTEYANTPRGRMHMSKAGKANKSAQLLSQ